MLNDLFLCKCLNEELKNKDKTDVNQVNEVDLHRTLRKDITL